MIPKGFFPIQDTGLITGLVGSGAGRLAGGDEASAARARRGDRARSRRRGVRLVLRQRQRQHAQYRALLHRAQAARRAQVDRARGDRPAAAAARQGAGRQAVPAASQDITVGGRISRGQFQYTLQDAEPRRAQHLGAEDARQAQDAAGARRRLHRSAGQCAPAHGRRSIATRRRASASSRR